MFFGQLIKVGQLPIVQKPKNTYFDVFQTPKCFNFGFREFQVIISKSKLHFGQPKFFGFDFQSAIWFVVCPLDKQNYNTGSKSIHLWGTLHTYQIFFVFLCFLQDFLSVFPV